MKRRIVVKIIPEKSRKIVFAQAVLVCASIFCLILAACVFSKEFL